MKIEPRYIAETASTNSWMTAHDDGIRDMAVWTDYQTAGRGCGTNTWESERGMNLLFSILIHPAGVPATSQFILSMANALALRDALADYADDIMIKWPNDIYWHDKKLAGTLIETSLSGSNIKSCIIGTGLNVNQTDFRSDAPNPVSLRQMLGHEVCREEVLQKVLQRFAHYMDQVNRGTWNPIRTRYRSWLYRRGETHRYRFADGSVEECRLLDVDDDGHLLLRRAGGDISRLAFKEVTFII